MRAKMARAYRFADLITYSGLTANEAKHVVVQRVIRADLKRTKGSGAHATYGFFDLFEACLVHRIYQLPGGTPIIALGHMIDAIRVCTQLDATLGTPGWAAFLDPATRLASAGYYFCWVCLANIPTAVKHPRGVRTAPERMIRLPTTLTTMANRCPRG